MEIDSSLGKEDLAELNVAIVHYWFVTWRGGEKVVESLLKLFPKADIYTLFYDKRQFQTHLGNANVYSSCLDIPPFRRHYQKLFPLYPAGIKTLRLQKKYDVIISSESGPAKGISNPEKTPHLCYIHSPMRYCWGYTRVYLESMPKWSRKLAEWRFSKLREWDSTTVDNVDLFVANSQNVADRVGKFYGKDAEVCYPPIALDWFQNKLIANRREYYLSFGAITPYKNIRLLVETFNKLDEKLIIIGSGSEKSKLERIAGDNIQFKGHLAMSEVKAYMQHAKALLFPGEEDFGMAPLEVMSQGVPAIAFKKGGALETVRENRRNPAESAGIFFAEPTVACLLEALKRFEALEDEFDPAWIRNHARGFGEDYFQRKFCGYLLDLMNRNH